jgi:hypothetical protein
MTILDRLEKRWGWLSFPGFLRYYALFHVLVFVLQYLQPNLGEVLEFNREKILSGEVWRLVTMFFANSQVGRPSLFALIFLFFVVNFLFMVSDGLEGAWGAFKTSLFYYTSILSVLAANFILPGSVSGMALYGSAFLAFATLFPRVEILLFLILPVQVRFLGMFAGGVILLGAISQPILLPFTLVAYANYLVWAGIPALRGRSKVLESVQRRKRFNAAKIPSQEAFHTCVVCKRTDLSDPKLEFRIGRDGEEYCTDHLPQDP